jgi:hypothetical protein
MSETSDPGQAGIMNLGEVHCPRCGEQMPAVRIPDGLQQLLWGGWTCPKCGCRMDKWGKALDSDAQGSAPKA